MGGGDLVTGSAAGGEAEEDPAAGAPSRRPPTLRMRLFLPVAPAPGRLAAGLCRCPCPAGVIRYTVQTDEPLWSVGVEDALAGLDVGAAEVERKEEGGAAPDAGSEPRPISDAADMILADFGAS